MLCQINYYHTIPYHDKNGNMSITKKIKRLNEIKLQQQDKN